MSNFKRCLSSTHIVRQSIVCSVFLVVCCLITTDAWSQGLTADSLVKNVLFRLGFVPTDTGTFHAYEVIEALNEGQIRVSVDCGAYRKYDTVHTNAGEPIYIAPSDAVEGWPLQVISHEDARKEEPWIYLVPNLFSVFVSGKAGSEREFMPFVHSGKFVINPPPPKTGSILHLFYRANPPRLTKLADTTLIGETDRPGMVHYAAYILSAVDWPEKSAQELQEYRWHVQERRRDQVGLWFLLPALPDGGGP